MNTTQILDAITDSLVILVVASFVLSGCATIMHGSYQQIEVSSSPPGARVMVDSNDVGITPLSVKLKRSSEQTISVGIAGYEEAELKITHSMAGWVWGNLALIVILAPIGLGIDLISGGFYAFSVDQLYVGLEKERVGVIGRPSEDKRTEVTIGENKP